MFDYKNKDGLEGIIMLSHVVYFERHDGKDTFDVFFDDGASESYTVPTDLYDAFKSEMIRYLQIKETKQC